MYQNLDGHAQIRKCVKGNPFPDQKVCVGKISGHFDFLPSLINSEHCHLNPAELIPPLCTYAYTYICIHATIFTIFTQNKYTTYMYAYGFVQATNPRFSGHGW